MIKRENEMKITKKMIEKTNDIETLNFMAENLEKKARKIYYTYNDLMKFWDNPSVVSIQERYDIINEKLGRDSVEYHLGEALAWL